MTTAADPIRSTPLPASLDGALALHRAAAAAYAAAARAAAARPAVWSTPVAEGKWSPAQITLHLVLAFEAVAREIREGVPMALRTTAWQRLLLRFTILRRLLRGGRFPRGARSPREARPPVPAEGPVPVEDGAVLIARFEALADGVEALLRQRVESDAGKVRLTHPYFGRLPAAQTVYISARHIDHHRGQLPV
jgi:hypothetical protein